jgi:very-short-patch-repair endonuclease
LASPGSGSRKGEARRHPDRARAQLRRDSLLRDDGFEVVHFTWQQITQTPDQVAVSIRKAFLRGARNAAVKAGRAG